MQKQVSSHFLDQFEELGLSRNEALVYLALLEEHPITGYKISQNSGLYRATVYEMLTRLVKRGGVKIVKSKEVKKEKGDDTKKEKDRGDLYSPIPPENFLASLEKRFNDARTSLVDDLTKFQQNEKDLEEFWTITNNDAIISNIQDMVNKAQKEVFFFINSDTYSFLLKDIFSKKVASGVNIIGFSYRDIQLPGTDLYSYKIDTDTKHSIIDDERIIITVDGVNSIIADMDVAKASQSMRPAQVTTATEFIKMKIVLYRMHEVISPSKFSLYLFDQDKSFIEDVIK